MLSLSRTFHVRPGHLPVASEEVAFWKKRDPIPRLKAAIQHDFEVTEEEFKEVDEKVRKLLDEAVAFAEAGAELPAEKLRLYGVANVPSWRCG